MRCVPLFLSIVLFSFMAAAQKLPPPAAPPPPVPKATPVDPPTKTEEELVAETLELIKQPIEWKERPLKGFNIKVITPRDTIYTVENVVEPGMGNVKVYSHVSVGEAAVYTVGKLSLPYVVTDEAILRNLYKEFSTGMAESEGVAFQHVSDFLFEGKLAVEYRSLPSDSQYQSARSRAFVYGKDVYFLYAMPTEDENEDDPPDSETIKARTSDFNKFFESLKPIPVAPAVTLPIKELPMFAGSFVDGKYTSEYFKFSFEPPKGWIMLTQDDVNDLRSWSHKMVTEQSGRNFSVTNRRRNLFSFASAPLGSDSFAIAALNIAFPSNSFNDVKRLANDSQKLALTLDTFRQVKEPENVKIGGVDAILMVNEIDVSGIKQEQYIYYFLLRGYVMTLSVNCHQKADCIKVLDSLSTWKSEAVK